MASGTGHSRSRWKAPTTGLLKAQKQTNCTIKFHQRLQSRAILLEQYKNGVNGAEMALKTILKELDPKSTTKTTASLWYNRFRNGDLGLGKGASKADLRLINDGTF
ncbi:hypothetical protein M3Y98_00451700 [Aphelenchoides besseyi]|nr:hypothetical protein M3Y98_00451700 [Aphelenchoides besseyi]